MRSFLVISLLACLMMACRSASHFTTRKYMSGRYVSGPALLHHVKVLEANESRQGAMTTFHPKANFQSTSQQDIYAKAEVTKTQKKIHGNISQETKSLCFFGKNKMRTVSKKPVRKPIKAALLTKIKLQKTEPEEEKNARAIMSVTSVILSGVGVTIDLVGSVLEAFAIGYSLPLFVSLGVTFGILGILFGILGIKQYKKEHKKTGYKNRTMLILGIVGAALGLGSLLGVFSFVVPDLLPF